LVSRGLAGFAALAGLLALAPFTPLAASGAFFLLVAFLGRGGLHGRLLRALFRRGGGRGASGAISAIQNHQKQWMLPRGQWRANPGPDWGHKTAGFRLSSSYSPVG